MTVDQERSSGREAGRHGLGVAWVKLDEDESLPRGSVGFTVGSKFVEEGLLELEDVFHVHAGDKGLSGGGGGIREDDVFEVVGTGRKDGGAFVDFGGIEEVENGEVLDLEDFVHAFEAESTLAVEEVGDVGLFESGLLSEADPGKFTCFDTLPEDFTEILLQDLKPHWRSIAASYEPRVTGRKGLRQDVFIRGSPIL